MGNNVKSQNEMEQEMLELNKQFSEFMHTKGIKAKWNLVVENIKKDAAEAPAKTASQIAKTRAETKANIAKANAYAAQSYTAESLSAEFNAFLKSKGLDTKYTVVITEE